MDRSDVLKLSREQLFQSVHSYVLRENPNSEIPSIQLILNKLREHGIHMTIQSNVNGYRIYWGHTYDELYTEDVLDGVCRVGLMAVLDN